MAGLKMYVKAFYFNDDKNKIKLELPTELNMSWISFAITDLIFLCLKTL